MAEDEMVGWHHRLNDHELSKLQEFVMDRDAWCGAVHGTAKSWTQQSDWTDWLTDVFSYFYLFTSYSLSFHILYVLDKKLELFQLTF